MTSKNLLPATIDFDNPKMVATLKATVATGATDAEFELFSQFCKATGLNPFKKEIWFIKTKDRLQLMTGINGFYEIANRHPQFDGLEVETVEQAGKLVKAVARCYRKDRSRPMVAEAYWSEYAKDYGNWKSMPRLMLSKCAESMALRKSFPQELNGLYTAEEMPPEYGADALDVTPQREVPIRPSTKKDLPPALANDPLPGESDDSQEEPHYYQLDLYAKEKADTWSKIRSKLIEKGCECLNQTFQVWKAPIAIKNLAPYEIEGLPTLREEAA